MKRISLLVAMLLAGSVSAAPKADLAKGKNIAEKVCAACHAYCNVPKIIRATR